MSDITPPAAAPRPARAARPKPGPLDKRLKQLTVEGLAHHYCSAAEFKTRLFPAQQVAPPRPLVKDYRCTPEFAHYHGRLKGEIAPGGLFELHDCYVGKGGTVMDAQRRVLYDDDLTSAYWLLFVSKLIQKADPQAGGKTTVTGRFLRGMDEPVLRPDLRGATLVSLAKPGPNVYGHWILDTLPMAWNFFEAVRLGIVRPPFRFLISDRTPPWARGFLQRLFNVPPELLVSYDDNATVVHAERLIVPSLLRVSPLISPRMNEFVEFVYDRFGLRWQPERPDLPTEFFISREGYADQGRRTLANALEIEAVMRDAGVVPIRPETLSWPDQLLMFSRARLVAGEFGSGTHNTLFSPASTVNLTLFNMVSNWNQSSIAALRDQDIVYLRPSVEAQVGTGTSIRYEYALEDVRDAIEVARRRADERAATP
ncbi:glycosyltransferase family 61 protein [Derxia gummosa]|uniref:Glycosyltransferase family 61 protein n=1 Tax=Derxia gummosa DSM 723 TaxID=1121388 RepID=A0A8B6X601_9BURK|nr:glycosyltransferase 61 family protein [Derxia gummosa]